MSEQANTRKQTGYSRFSNALKKMDYVKRIDVEDPESFKIHVQPTPSTIINAMTGIGGIPKGKFIEIFGPNGCGKSTFSIQTAAMCLQENPEHRVLYVDLEQTMDLNYAQRLGVPMFNNRFDLVQPAYGEEASKLILISLEESLHDLIIIDSLSTMNTKSFLESESNQIGQRAKLSTELLNKMLGAMLKNTRQPPVFLINQVRTKIDLQNPRGTKIGSTSTHAMDHYVVMRFQLRQQESSLAGNKKFDYKKQLQARYDTYRIRVSLIKNKYGGRKDIEGTFFIEEGNGINDSRSVVEMAVEVYCTSNGAWYDYKGLSDATSVSRVHGKEALIETILNTPAIYEELRDRILADIDAAPAYHDTEEININSTPPLFGNNTVDINNIGGGELSYEDQV